MPFDWSLFTPEKLEIYLLADFYSINHAPPDRRADGESMLDVDQQTGIPLSEGLLKAPGHRKSSYDHALENRFTPKKRAAGFVQREDGWTTDANGNRVPRLIGMARIPPGKWTEEEALIINDLASRIKLAVQSLIEKGWAEAKPVPFEEYKNGYGQDGLPWVWKATPAGIAHAEEIIPRDYPEQMQRPRFSAEFASQADREQIARVAPWHDRELRAGGKE